MTISLYKKIILLIVHVHTKIITFYEKEIICFIDPHLLCLNGSTQQVDHFVVSRFKHGTPHAGHGPWCLRVPEVQFFQDSMPVVHDLQASSLSLTLHPPHTDSEFRGRVICQRKRLSGQAENVESKQRKGISVRLEILPLIFQ